MLYNPRMDKKQLQLKIWDTLSEDQKRALAEEIAPTLPSPFKFKDLQTFAQGDQHHTVARFDSNGVTFILIPGSDPAVLGYDPDQPLQPEPLALWQRMVEQFNIEITLAQYISNMSTPLRTVSIAPFLLEEQSWEAGLEWLPLDHPAIRDNIPAPGTSTQIYSANQDPIKIYTTSEGQSYACRMHWKRQAEMVELLAKEGFRLPTSDEWEYACAAGSRTLFRWGNDCPMNFYPIDLEAESFAHRQPNAFGLSIGFNPYEWEMVAEPDQMRNGDGGSSMCGGEEFFFGWLPLAPAFLDPASSEFTGDPVPGAFVRRALSLP